MAKADFWQDANRFRAAVLTTSVLALCLLAGVRTVPAGETAGTTPRQKEILENLHEFRPDWATGEGVWMLGSWDTDIGLERLVDLPVGPGNAAACFRRLEDVYESEAGRLGEEGFASRGVEALLEAADMAECRFVPEYYPEYDSIESKQPSYLILNHYLDALLRRADALARQGEYRDAERCYRAALVCGWHLTNDRYSNIVFVSGLRYKQLGIQMYGVYLKIRGDKGKSGDAEGYYDIISTLVRAWTWKSTIALGETADFACLPAIVRIATGDKEVFWRKTAVERLAVLRYGVMDLERRIVIRNPAFERVADEALSSIAARDPDPSVRRLAVQLVLEAVPPDYGDMEHRFTP